MKFQYIYLFLALIFITMSCEDVIDVKLEEDQQQLVVDAWVNNKMETQVIKLRRTSPYFDSSPSPAVTGATVELTDNEGNIFAFTDDNNDGDYTWEPPVGQSFGKEGNIYTMLINLDGKEYTSTSTMNPIMDIDSIGVEYREESLGDPEGHFAQIYATDLVGQGNTYWIKTYKNGQFLNKPQEINVSYDGGFSPGADFDAILFLPPIREAINRVPDDGDDAVDDSSVPPYAVGDSIRVEIHSLNLEAFYFLQQAQIQMTSGDAGIFATPIFNVSSNIVNVDPSNEEETLGFFCVSMVSTEERVVE